MLRWLVLLLPASALAQPGAMPPQEAPSERADRAFVALGAMVGGAGPPEYAWLRGAYTLEGGVTLPIDAPIRVRVHGLMTLVGGTMESDWSGDFKRYAAGGELRLCRVGGGVCWFADVDAGWQQQSMFDNFDLVRDDHGLYAGLRGGLDVGWSFRVRLALEIDRQFGVDRGNSYSHIALVLALGWQF